eukprot:SAG31_NODE_13438_length_869_cov_1.183117_1_plen_44_part_00
MRSEPAFTLLMRRRAAIAEPRRSDRASAEAEAEAASAALPDLV